MRFAGREEAKILFAQKHRERRDVSRRASGALCEERAPVSAADAASALTTNNGSLRSLRPCANHLLPGALAPHREQIA
jgi:hypothetical protein